jgi:CRISPR-associated exonuclease Cas4
MIIMVDRNSFSESPRIGGTLVWYYSICKREVWLMCRGIEPERQDESLVLGRLVDSNSYARERHSVNLGNSQFDIVREKGETFVVAEIKKSSRSLEASTLQLKHYLYELEKEGIKAEGELLFPREKKKNEVILDDDSREQLDQIYAEIIEIGKMAKPPKVSRCRYCSKCAYREWCWS